MVNNTGWDGERYTRWEHPRSVTFEDGGSRAVLNVGLSQDDRDACKHAVLTLERMLQPASREEVAVLLGRLLLHSAKQPKHDEKQWKLIFDDYQTDLAEFPLDILEETAVEWRRSKPWWPHVSDLLAIAKPKVDERRAMLARAKDIASGKHDKPKREPWTPPTDEEKARVHELVRKTTNALRAS